MNGFNLPRWVAWGLVVLTFVAAMLMGGCVQVEITNDHSKGGRAHQDIARTTSSTQSADGALEVPVSLVPK